MAWVQIKPFSLSKMGTSKNWCLQNVRLGFGLNAKYATAKLAMAENSKKGTLHPISSLPKNVAVPLFSNTGVWGHVMVSDKGTLYSDGVRVNWSLNDYQWGEWLEGVQVVRWEANKTNSQLADEVLQGLWGNGAERKTKLTNAGYDYNAVQAEVNKKLAKNTATTTKTTSTTIKVGDTVIVNGKGTASSLGNGAETKSFKNQKMKVISIANSRYGCNQYNKNSGITGWWLKSQIKKA